MQNILNFVQTRIESPSQRRCKSLVEYGYAVLTSSDMDQKVSLSLEGYEAWKTSTLPIVAPTTGGTSYVPVPKAPDFPSRPSLVSASPAQRKSGLMRLIHSLCHIESVAIDLSWDMLVRFAESNPSSDSKLMPPEFFDEWAKIAAEEARHFVMWDNHLKQKGFSYGSFPIHEALWESAIETKDDIVDRLCICHMVHEAHGLDVTWRHEKKMSGDLEARRLLDVIHAEEITHVSAGLRWFRYILSGRGIAELGDEQESKSTGDEQLKSEYERIMKAHFRGELKPPYNIKARDEAGFPRHWYMGSESE